MLASRTYRTLGGVVCLVCVLDHTRWYPGLLLAVLRGLTRWNARDHTWVGLTQGKCLTAGLPLQPLRQCLKWVCYF